MLKKNIYFHIAFVLILLSSQQVCYSQSFKSKRSSEAGKVFLENGPNDIDYLLALERATEVLETAKADAEFGARSLNLINGTDQTKKNVDLLLLSLKETGPSIRNQMIYHIMLKDLQSQLEAQNTMINLSNDNLNKIQKRMAGLKRDTVFMALVMDNIYKKQYSTELLGIKNKHNITDSLIKSSMRIMTAKKRLVVDTNMNIENAMTGIEKKLDKSGINILSKEYEDLWYAIVKTDKNELTQNIKGKCTIEKDVLAYYIKYNFGSLITLIVLMIFLGWYTWRNVEYVQSTTCFDMLSSLSCKYLNNSVLFSIIIICLNVIIVSNLSAPSLFVESLQLVLLIVLTFFFKGHYGIREIRGCYYLFILFIVLFFLDLFLEISFFQRCIFITTNVLCICYGIIQLKHIKDGFEFKFFKWANIIFISFNGLALIFNVFGRVSLSHTLSLAAIIALIQIIGLNILVNIIIEIIILQVLIARIKRNIQTLFDYETLTDRIKKPLIIAALCIWFIVLASNLNMWEPLSSLIRSILNYPIIIGSITFTMSSVLLFFIIIWVAHLIQNYVAYFFVEITNEDSQDKEEINKEQHSKLLIARLIVLIVGYLIAIAASGMPINKLSIIIGSLGVGVGLGLQNVVTNFVSGIILIFDRPIQVGDIIDVDSKSGRVKSMGLRSTKINSADGAEIIIPNGNILSQNITNWTYTDNLKQVETTFSIKTNTSVENINETIQQTIHNLVLNDNNRSPQIYYNAVSEENYIIIVKFWCSIYRTDEVLSNFRQALFINFKNKGIVLSI